MDASSHDKHTARFRQGTCTHKKTMFSLRSSSKPAPTDGSHAHAAHSKRGRPNDAAELAALIREARAAFADAGATDAQLVGSGEEGLTDAQVKRCVVCSVYVDCVSVC